MGFRATYKETVFHNAVNKYTVIKYKADDENISDEAKERLGSLPIEFTASGYGMPQTDAVEVMLDGVWEKGKYGFQFVIESWEEIIPQTAEGVQAYLACGLIKGIGEKTAADIVGQFGVGAIDILDGTPEKLLEIRGITESKLEAIKESYALSRPISGLMTFLAPYDITPNKAMKIQKKFGANSLSVIKSSPFKLCKIPGFGFLTVDSIAVKTGCKPNDPLRIRGALFYALEEARDDGGHLYLSTEDLCKKARKLLNKRLPKQSYLNLEEIKDELYATVTENGLIHKYNSIYLPTCFRTEGIVAKRVAELLLQSAHQPIYTQIEQYVDELGVSLSPEQEAAVKMCFNHEISIITGAPGTGKTTVLKAILYAYQKVYEKGKILLAAPTGRASRRMAESTGFQNAKTLHSALGLISGDEEKSHLNKHELLDVDLIVIDEMSMVDMWLALQLFSRLRNGTKILMIGDPDQLPSVGAGNVFRELITCGLIPVTRLVQIFRQSSESSIPYNAKLVNQGVRKLQMNTNDFIFKECEIPPEVSPIIHQIFLEEVEKSGLENVQILSPMKERGDASAEKLSLAIQELVNPPADDKSEIRVGNKVFRVGDRVMQTKNQKKVSNGDVGFISDIKNDVVTINFSDSLNERIVEYDARGMKTIDLAYGITVHKAMGSEYETVILPMLSGHMINLNRNMLYTAITRAKKRVFIVGQQGALSMAIRKENIEKRNTWLGKRMMLYYQSFTERAQAA